MNGASKPICVHPTWVKGLKNTLDEYEENLLKTIYTTTFGVNDSFSK